MLCNLHFFSSKFRLFHNATLFGFCITHILNTECAKIWKKKKIRRRKVKWDSRCPVTISSPTCLYQKNAWTVSIVGSECFLLLIHRRIIIKTQLPETEPATENLFFFKYYLMMDKIRRGKKKKGFGVAIQYIIAKTLLNWIFCQVCLVKICRINEFSLLSSYLEVLHLNATVAEKSF